MFGGQLYGSSSSAPTWYNVYTVGTGLPTTAGQTAASLPGMPTASGPGPNSFSLVDFDGAGGIDTMYVADDRTYATGGGIQKWTLSGGVWTLQVTYNAANNGLPAARPIGLAAARANGNIVIVAATGTNVIVLHDDGATPPAATIVATAVVNTAYRGVAFVPPR